MAAFRKRYKWFYDHVHSKYYSLLLKWCALPFGGEKKLRERLIAPVAFSPGERILEMGCGTGGATALILMKAGQTSQVIGLDLSIGQLRVTKKRAELSQVHLVEADAARAPFHVASFDKVFITHAIHEIPRANRMEVLTEAKRVLKDSGEIVILELDHPRNLWIRLAVGLWFFYWLPFNFETRTRRDMLKHGVVEEVQEAGFRRVRKESKYRGVFQVVQGVK
jgi:ubiquinone/menaquinone biosynthesis C-methylase UbiE